MAGSCCSCPQVRAASSPSSWDRRDQPRTSMNRPVDITALLEAWSQGDLEARDRLIPAGLR